MSNGTILDFAGPYFVNDQGLAFGHPTMFLRLNLHLAEELRDADTAAVRARWATLRARWVMLRARWVMLRARWGDAKSSLGDAESSLGDAESSLG